MKKSSSDLLKEFGHRQMSEFLNGQLASVMLKRIIERQDAKEALWRIFHEATSNMITTEANAGTRQTKDLAI